MVAKDMPAVKDVLPSTGLVSGLALDPLPYELQRILIY